MNQQTSAALWQPTDQGFSSSSLLFDDEMMLDQPVKHTDAPLRILFVFAWLVAGSEETEIRLLAEKLDPRRYEIDVAICFRKPGMLDQTHRQLEAIGVSVDRTAYHLSLEKTVAYLASIIPSYDIVVSRQNVADIYPALERIHLRPPLIEHGGLVSDALGGPKHFTARYVGMNQSIRNAAASEMPGREADTLTIPPIVDLDAFGPTKRAAARALLGVADEVPLVGWIGQLDPGERVEDFITAAAIVRASHPDAQFLVIGGTDASAPEYALQLRAQAAAAGFERSLRFLGDRDNVHSLLSALDIFVSLSRDGMPRVIAEAGAASLAVIAAADHGSMEQIAGEQTMLSVPHEQPQAVAAAITRLIDDPALRARLGSALRSKAVAEHSVETVLPQWTRLFDSVAAREPAPAPSLFKSFLQGGFECSSHRRAHDRRRIDVIAATGHDRRAAEDYARLAEHGMLTVRDGLRWHLIEQQPGFYDWASLDQQLASAKTGGTEVIWDIMHYGWPDDIDIWSPEFADRFAAFARAAAAYIAPRSPGRRFYAPINEISFLSWGGGDVAYLNPFSRGRGFELKAQLARASIAAMKAIRAADPAARFVQPEPLINILTHPDRPEDAASAEGHRQSQFQAWDMIAGYSWPQLGGEPGLLDIVGINYYHNNQWVHGGAPLHRGEPGYKPFRHLLAEVYARYGRPIFVAETGIEGDERADWFAYVSDEVREARQRGIPVEGICLYPVLDHPGWDDERHCPNGLIGLDRHAHAPLANLVLAHESHRAER